MRRKSRSNDRLVSAYALASSLNGPHRLYIFPTCVMFNCRWMQIRYLLSSFSLLLLCALCSFVCLWVCTTLTAPLFLLGLFRSIFLQWRLVLCCPFLVDLSCMCLRLPFWYLCFLGFLGFLCQSFLLCLLKMRMYSLGCAAAGRHVLTDSCILCILFLFAKPLRLWLYICTFTSILLAFLLARFILASFRLQFLRIHHSNSSI